MPDRRPDDGEAEQQRVTLDIPVLAGQGLEDGQNGTEAEGRERAEAEAKAKAIETSILIRDDD